MFTPESLARINYAAKRQMRAAMGQPSGPTWNEADQAVRDSFVESVQCALNGGSPADLHQLWLDRKIAQGWTRTTGQKDSLHKKHPSLVPYDELPDDDKRKDMLMFAIVKALTEPVEALYVEDDEVRTG